MLRLLTLLSVAMFLTLLIGGRDYGQQRFGLRDRAPEVAALPPVEPRPVTLPETAVAAVQARYQPPVPPEPAALPAVTLVVPAAAPEPAPVAEPEPEPAPAALPVRYVTASAVNVRGGPSTGDSVVGRLTRGEAVSVVGPAGDGWVQVRIEGDGVEGYVAARFLSDAAP